MGPTHLNEIEVVRFRFARESAGKIERRHHAVSRQRFKTRRYASVGEVESRTAVKGIEPVSGACSNRGPARLQTTAGCPDPYPAPQEAQFGKPTARSPKQTGLPIW